MIYLLPWQIAIKAADISNPARCLSLSKTWSEHIMEEFFRQGQWTRCVGWLTETAYTYQCLLCVTINNWLWYCFVLAGDNEKSMNLPISFLCDRTTTTIPKSQSGVCLYLMVTILHRKCIYVYTLLVICIVIVASLTTVCLPCRFLRVCCPSPVQSLV